MASRERGKGKRAEVGHCNKLVLKYLGAVVSDDGSNQEVLSMFAQAIAAPTKLKPIWRDNNTSLGSKLKLMHSLEVKKQKTKKNIKISKKN